MWLDAIEAVFECTAGARWRKAAKCKSLIKQVQSHLTILRNRRKSIIRQSRADIAQLLQDGLLQRALERAVQLYKDQCLLCAYDQIEQFCGCIISNISHITTQSSWHALPIDTSEAVSSLIFAASRCGELPQLHLLRSLFKESYGCEFDLANVELQPGNLVKFQIKQNLCINSLSNNMKQKLINEIANDYGCPLVFQDPELQVNKKCFSESKPEVLDLEIQDNSSDIDENWIQLSEYETQRKDMPHFKPLAAIPSQSRIDLNGYYSYTQNKKNATFVDKLEVSSTRTSLESSTPQIYETAIVYHNSFVENPLRRENGKKLVNGRFSLDSSLDKRKAQDNSSWSSHVHPSLPEYEDLVDRLKDLKAECRRHKSFSFLKVV
ncbi:IST1-like protein [Durio zibethinus]|uniref:IST1-like protein n=1 Tax=Durio zibethinus TaxID=66656 RepID=A0A6P5WPQ2_DURZI|nr:IST1-like protein [Durio zibethinus]